MNRYFSLLIIALLFAAGCIEVTNPYSEIPPGIWRAELYLDKEVRLPFNFEASYNDDNKLVLHIINGTERIEVTETTFGRTKDLRDTIDIHFPLFDSHISAEYKENVLEGLWHVHNRENYAIPFVAFHGQSHRFSNAKETPGGDVTGKWEATFEVETPDVYPAIGEFQQTENIVNGTFRTETGDYRYLDGIVMGNELKLSCFDGSHAFLFTADLSESGNLAGKFYSGTHYKTNWVAKRNEAATLTDPNKLSQITTPDKKITFSLPNTEGKIIDLNDAQYQGKPKIITMMGTWCPNCLDESKFLINYKKKHPEKDFQIIALAFEKYRNADKAQNMIKEYKKRLDIPYEILMAGYYDKEEATKEIGFIDKIISYPTMLFLNKDNEVLKVHTGFNGPATSQWEDFKKEFEEDVTRILE